MHRHNLSDIPPKIPNQLFEGVNFSLEVGFLLGFILRKFDLQCLKLMLRVQVLGEES